MIVDRLENLERYRALDVRIYSALHYLATTDIDRLEVGEHPIDGRDIFAIVADYALKPREQGRLEAHRKYLDIQYLACGTEWLGYVPLADQAVSQAYSGESDVVFFAGESSLLQLDAGMFAILYPEDLHMPGIGDPQQRVRKVVVKVKI